VVVVATWAVIARSGDDPKGGGSTPSPLPNSSMVLNQENGGPRHLVVLDTRGAGNTIDIVDEPDALKPSISEDRRRIAYVVAPDGSKPGIVHVALSDGTEDKALLTRDAVETCPLMGRPVWSSDNDHLAMVCYETDTDTTSLGIWIVRRDGAGLRRVVSWSSALTSPSWGGDDRIYFVRKGSGDDRDQIYSVPSTGGKPRLLTEGGEHASNPDMGKPGLLYLRSPARLQAGDIYLRTKGVTSQLTKTGDVKVPVWSPDFKAVAWLAPSRQDKDQQAVWTASFDTSPSGGPSLGEPKQLPMSGTPGPPAWGSR
jgi:WD40-like Beta Propeller Repeat